MTEIQTEAVIATALPAVVLRNAFLAASLSASKDSLLPVLAAVHVSKTGDVLLFRGTDRYRLTHVNVTLQNTPDGDWETLVSVADVKRVVALLPKTDPAYGAPVLATLSPTEVSLPGMSSASFTPVDGDYPRTKSVIPISTAELPQIALKPEHIADLAKMPGRYKNHGMVFQFAGERKPVTVKWVDNKHENVEYLYLIMPERIPE